MSATADLLLGVEALDILPIPHSAPRPAASNGSGAPIRAAAVPAVSLPGPGACNCGARPVSPRDFSTPQRSR